MTVELSEETKAEAKQVEDEVSRVDDSMVLSETEARAAAAQLDAPAPLLVRPIPIYPTLAGVDAGGVGIVGGRRRSAMASLLIRPCKMRSRGAFGDIFWV